MRPKRLFAEIENTNNSSTNQRVPRKEAPKNTVFFNILVKYRNLAKQRPKVYAKPGNKTEFECLDNIIEILDDAKVKRNHFQWLKACKKVLETQLKTMEFQKKELLKHYLKTGKTEIGDKYQGTITAANKIDVGYELLKMELERITRGMEE